MANSVKTISFTPKDFVKGISPLQQSQNAVGGFFAKTSAVDVYRNPGFISPGIPATSFSGNALTSQTLGLGGFDAVNNVGYAMINAKFLQYDLTNYALTNNGTFPHTLPGGSVSNGCDIIKYTINGYPCIIYFSDQYFGVYDFNVSQPIEGNVFFDQYSHSVPTGSAFLLASPHRAVIFAGKMYFTNGYYIGMFDGTVGATGTLTVNKLILQQTFIAYDIKMVKGQLEINCSDGSRAKKLTWDGISVLPLSEDDLEDSTVGATQTVAGIPFVFTGGSTSGAVLRQKNFYGFQPLQNIDKGSVPSTFQTDSAASQIYWGDSANSKVWSFGTAFPAYSYRGTDETGTFPDVLNCPIAPTGATINTLKLSPNSAILVGSQTNTTYYLEYFDLKSANYNTAASFQTNFLSLPNDTVIKYLRFNFLTLSAGDAFTPSFYFNGDMSSVSPTGDAAPLDITLANKDIVGNSQTYWMSQQVDSIAIGGTWSNCSTAANKVIFTKIDIGYQITDH